MKYTYFGEHGREVDEKSGKAFAKIKNNEELNKVSYYLSFVNGRLYNPYATTGGTNIFSWKSVNEQQFLSYKSYLETKKESVFKRLERTI